MNSLIERIKEYVMEECRKYKETSEDRYDFWNEHIRYVYREAVGLAKKYGAEETVVSLGALLHDIALIEKAGSRKDHHLNGKILSNEILDRFSCPEDLKNRVLGCVQNHRSPKNAENIEELCVCDADCLAHLDNIPMLFNTAFNRDGISLNEVRSWMRNSFEHDYNDLSERTKEAFRDRYDTIKSIVLGDMQENGHRYICKIASPEEMEQKWDYEIGIHAEKENWIAWKAEAIEGCRSGRSIPYYGILDGTVICEATAILNPSLKPAQEHMVELCAFRTNKAYRGRGYFSKLKDFMLKDLKQKGYAKAVVGVEPEEALNRKMYHHWGFTEFLCSGTETYPDGTVIRVDFFGKSL